MVQDWGVTGGSPRQKTGGDSRRGGGLAGGEGSEIRKTAERKLSLKRPQIIHLSPHLAKFQFKRLQIFEMSNFS